MNSPVTVCVGTGIGDHCGGTVVVMQVVKLNAGMPTKMWLPVCQKCGLPQSFNYISPQLHERILEAVA